MTRKKLTNWCCALAIGVGTLCTTSVAPSAWASSPTATWRPSTPPMPMSHAIEDHVLTQAVLSPDGKHIASIVPNPGGNPLIKVWKTEDLSKDPTVIGSTRMRFVQVSFIKNDRLMVIANQPVTAGAGSSWFSKRLFTDLEGKEWVEPLRGAFSEMQIALGTFLSRLPKDPDHVLMTSGGVFEPSDVMRVNVRTGVGTRLARQAEDESLLAAGIDSDLNFRLKQSVRAEGGNYFVDTFYRDVGGEWRKLDALTFDVASRRFLSVLRMSRDGTKLWVLTNRFGNYRAIHLYDIATDTLTEQPVFANTEFDATGIVFWTNQDEEALESDPIAGFCFYGPTDECVYSNPILQRLKERLDAAFPGRKVSLGRVIEGGRKAMVRVSAPHFPPTYFFYQEGRGLTRIVSENEGLNPAHMGTAQWVTYKARDGLDIPAIVTLPPGYDMARHGRIPLIVMPHGGPWARDDFDWDIGAWAQLFATRGFAVLQPQYRGSDDLGLQLWLAGDNQWGAKMQDDKDDGVRWLIEQGVADPNQVAMYGYSYGGFAAAAAAARSSGDSRGMYQCAIAGAPAVDLERIRNDWGEGRINRLAQARTVTGWDPMQHLDQIRIPFLIFHGSFDRQADTIHSRTAAARIRSVNPNANFNYVEIPQMSHTVGQMTPDQRRQFIPLILDMLDHNCGNISQTFSEPGLELPRGQRSSRTWAR